MSSVKRIVIAVLAGLSAGAFVLGVGLAYGWILDNMPWSSVLLEPEAPHVSGGDVARVMGVVASVFVLFGVGITVLSAGGDDDA